MSAAHDPYLEVPLDGVQLIEASAGTGKTFTLATLVVRLVVERGLRVGQVLAVTFTEAATQELRRRIRERLQLAHGLVGAARPDAADAERAVTWDILRRRRALGEADEALRLRLHLAVLDIDLAAIFTIHGFCTRILHDHALETGQDFARPELLTNVRALHQLLATDLWRVHGQQAGGAEDLAALWKDGPDALAKDLDPLLKAADLVPDPENAADAAVPAPDVDAAERRLLAVEETLRVAWRREGKAFFAALEKAMAAAVLNGNSYKATWVEQLRDWLHRSCAAARLPRALHAKLEKITQAALDKGTNKGRGAETPRAGALGQAVDAVLAASAALDAALLHRRLARLHAVRAEAGERLQALKRVRHVLTYDDLIDEVDSALCGPHGAALAQRLREQYAVALVDEFQDTDARQWNIFRRVFGVGSDAPGLFLIGDPKQAIYGFRGGDVQTYLAAAKEAAKAAALTRNFRARPTLLAALNALYGGASGNPFGVEGIQFETMAAGGTCSDADFLRDGTPAPALTLWRAPAQEAEGNSGKSHSAPGSRALVTAACVGAIRDLLAAAQNGLATIRDKRTGAMRAVVPGDIAVLVRKHKEATRVQQALAEIGIPAVAAGKLSLFATEQAQEVLAVLLALVHGGDEGRLRAALATVLLGLDAQALAELAQDENAHRGWHERFARWQARADRGGPLALLTDLCAQQAPRLMGLLDGERRVSNYLQLAEVLQAQRAGALGLRGLADWLERAIVSADENDETQQLRLESDARRVQIVTLHKSKGLEYPLVFLPFVGIGSKPPPHEHMRCVRGADGTLRLHWKIDAQDPRWKEAGEAATRESLAEEARLLYVGLTRAQHALWVACGPLYRADATGLGALLAGLDQRLPVAGIVVDDSAASDAPQRLALREDAAIQPPREARRSVRSDWWVHSFSQLVRSDAGGEVVQDAATIASGGHDEPEAIASAAAADAADLAHGLGGTRFGVALHAALEVADFRAWRGWTPGAAAEPGEQAGLVFALRDGGYAGKDVEAGLALATRLVGQTLTVALPEGVRLCDLPESARRPEIEFQFSLRPTRVDALLDLLHAHGVVRQRDRFGARRRLQGLMTGKIDLTYRHADRWYVIDYKTNRLSAYDAAGLQQAMEHSEYDLQALIYTLALHRWLRFRLGAGYAYERDFGGVRYLFCRGLDATRSPSPGIHAWRFEPELIYALDALFGRETEAEVTA